MDIFIKLVWAVVPGVIVGVIMAIWNSRQKRHDRHVAEKEESAIRESTLRLSLLVATAQLSYAVAMAYKRGQPNGEMEVGINQYNRAMQAFREFEREQVSRNLVN